MKMPKIPQIGLSLMLLLAILTSCRDKITNNPSEYVARVEDKYLYRSDIAKVLPTNLSSEDSAIYAKRYVDDWIMRKLLYFKALQNVDDEKWGISKKIEDFSEDIYIHTYEELYINSKVDDKKLSESEIKAYYEAHKNEFVLNENIVIADFVQLPKKIGNIDKLESLLKSDDEQKHEQLKEYASQFANKFYFGKDNWISATDLMQKLPIKSNNPEYFKSNKYFSGQDSTYFYMARIYDFMNENQQAPLSYSRNAIKKVLMQKKRYEMIKSVRNKLYEDALRKNVFEIYN